MAPKISRRIIPENEATCEIEPGKIRWNTVNIEHFLPSKNTRMTSEQNTG
jgi:hypothetical protein